MGSRSHRAGSRAAGRSLVVSCSRRRCTGAAPWPGHGRRHLQLLVPRRGLDLAGQQRAAGRHAGCRAVSRGGRVGGVHVDPPRAHRAQCTHATVSPACRRASAAGPACGSSRRCARCADARSATDHRGRGLAANSRIGRLRLAAAGLRGSGPPAPGLCAAGGGPARGPAAAGAPQRHRTGALVHPGRLARPPRRRRGGAHAVPPGQAGRALARALCRPRCRRPGPALPWPGHGLCHQRPAAGGTAPPCGPALLVRRIRLVQPSHPPPALLQP